MFKPCSIQVSQMFLSNIRKDTKNNYEIRSIIKVLLILSLKYYHTYKLSFQIYIYETYYYISLFI